ncbi:MAG: UDP-2,4-diacetamido-2,4,6-trideoxy-beta-L-altropyranose hydrolase [Flavobacteriales bacterium]
MNKNIFIRCDGGTHTGMGHMVRCMALADMLRSHFSVSLVMQQTDNIMVHRLQRAGYTVQFIPRTDDFAQDVANLLALIHEPSIIVLDGYHFDTAYQQAIKSENHKLVAIDDLHAWHQVADVVINHADGVSESSYSKEPYTKLLLGLRYALLRQEFLHLTTSHQQRKAIEKFFISMGAADVQNNTMRLASALLKLESVKEIHLMVSHVNPHLHEIEAWAALYPAIVRMYSDIDAAQLVRLLHQMDLVICPASSISLEACAVGVGLAVGYTADNQMDNFKALVQHGLAFEMGDLNALSENEFINCINQLRCSIATINQQIANQRLRFDGESGGRIAEEIISLK